MKLRIPYSIPASIACVSIFLCCFTPAHAGQERAVRPLLLHRMLSAAGIETGIIDLDRNDEFVKGVTLTGEQGATLMIGLPAEGLRPGLPFLLAIDGDEAIVQRTANGDLIVVGAPDIISILGIDDMVDCILDTVDDFLDEIDSCGIDPFCYMFASISLSVDLPLCVREIL